MNSENSKILSIDGVITEVLNNYPNAIITKQKKKYVSFKMSKLIGVTVFVRKKRLVIDVFYPSLKTKMLFYSVIFFGAIYIPLLVYLFTHHRKFRKMKKELKQLLILK